MRQPLLGSVALADAPPSILPGGFHARALTPRPFRPAGSALRALPGSPPLTQREHEIATMASARWTDREIAEALLISVRTVESHLASVYRKVGVSSRRDLPRAFG